MIEVFRKAGLTQAVDALEMIYAEEVSHVAYGSKWFNFLCGRENQDPKPVIHAVGKQYFNGDIRPPFKEEKRTDAGLTPHF